MKTILKDWSIITVVRSNEDLIGSFLWGTVVEDQTLRFKTGQFMYTSMIMSIDAKAHLIETRSGSTYEVIGERGKSINMSPEDFSLIKEGFTLEQIATLRCTN